MRKRKGIFAALFQNTTHLFFECANALPPWRYTCGRRRYATFGMGAVQKPIILLTVLKLREVIASPSFFSRNAVFRRLRAALPGM